MSTPMSNIRVFVQWTEQTVFAGEDVECEITFKNIATTPTPSRASLHPSSATGNGFAPGVESPRKPTVIQPKNGVTSPRPRPQQSPSNGHKTNLSLNAPSPVRSHRTADSWNGAPITRVEGGKKKSHGRSLSIMSIGASERSTIGGTLENDSTTERPRLEKGKGHGRASSLQIVPRRHGANGGPPSAPLGQRSSTHPSPLLLSSFSPFTRDYNSSERNSRRNSGIQNTPGIPNISKTSSDRRKPSGSFQQEFKFPLVSSKEQSNGGEANDPQDGVYSPRAQGPSLSTPDPPAPTPAARVISPASAIGTPRNSGDFYFVSNNSTETLASEYVGQQGGRIPPYGGNLRRPASLVVPINRHRPPETLMMGYAQISGSFTLDGSLISQAPFEEVKRKGAVGGQGGGVIGIESNKRDSSLLGGLGWGNIGQSIGGLLGGGELSSIKDMRGVASSRSVPLLSTPQSILFVDLRLAPGESRSYKYTFKLPRGLPPTHRGKAIKISYKLVIGTQRPGGSKEQQVKSVEIPFRVLGSVNNHGELLGHDLMNPYIILRDQARVKVLDSPDSSPDSTKKLEVNSAAKPNESTLDDFLSYTDDLLIRSRENSSQGLLSPTERKNHRQSSIEEPVTAKEAIDMAILRSNVTQESQQSANRFEIARSGKRVAVIMLARPAYRLGETITAAIDFTDADIPCYAVHMSLESSEKVDNSIALRSEASVHRVTRKIYVSHAELSLFARRVVFSPTIPVSATPEFITSGVSLEWKIRIEFVTPRLTLEDNEMMAATEDLLEEISRDDRGITLASAEVLDCESFEIAVPIRVYGALAGNTERDENPLDGLVV